MGNCCQLKASNFKTLSRERWSKILGATSLFNPNTDVALTQGVHINFSRFHEMYRLSAKSVKMWTRPTLPPSTSSTPPSTMTQPFKRWTSSPAKPSQENWTPVISDQRQSLPRKQLDLIFLSLRTVLALIWSGQCWFQRLSSSVYFWRLLPVFSSKVISTQ